MIHKLKTLSKNIKYELNIQTQLSDDWIIKNLNSKPYFDSIKVSKQIIVNKSKILTIIGNLNNTTNSTNMLILKGNYGFVNDNFYEQTEYNNLKTFIDNRLTVSNIKKKNLIIGNLYERPDGSRFVFLGIKYIIKKLNKVEKKNNTFSKYFSDLKTKYYIFNVDNNFVEELNSKNLIIFQDLGNNGLLTDIEIKDYLINHLNNTPDIFKSYDDKKITSVKIQFKEEPYNKIRFEELKKSKNLILSADGAFYLFTKNKEYCTDERVSGRPLSPVYYKYDLYQKISITNNQIVMHPKLKHDFLGTNSWYGNSSYTFDDSFSLKNKTLCAKSDTFNKMDNSKIFTIEYIEV